MTCSPSESSLALYISQPAASLPFFQLLFSYFSHCFYCFYVFFAPLRGLTAVSYTLSRPMDPLNEIESWAANAVADDEIIERPDDETIVRYQDLFGCSYDEAVAKILDHRAELHGHLSSTGQRSDNRQADGDSVAYLLRLEGDFPDPSAVRSLAGLADMPEMVTGSNDAGDVTHFCRVDGSTKSAILSYLQTNKPAFRPTFLQITRAEKRLSDWSLFPMLGVDSTFPQFRMASPDAHILPSQTQYPVWYFFYGMLADPTELSVILRLTEPPRYRQAIVAGGVLMSERQLIDAPVGLRQTSIVQGQAYLVETANEEESLRFSVTDKYEVVRCEIDLLDDRKIGPGLTFRYITR